jgi:TRAP-type uncharacterized transport system substrate-binding protein
MSDLKGKHVLVGPAGGGTNQLAMQLLAASGVTRETASLINMELPDYVDALGRGKADAGHWGLRTADAPFWRWRQAQGNPSATGSAAGTTGGGPA